MIDLEKCAGCGKSVEICPGDFFQMDAHNSIIANEAACTFCGVSKSYAQSC